MSKPTKGEHHQYQDETPKETKWSATAKWKSDNHRESERAREEEGERERWWWRRNLQKKNAYNLYSTCISGNRSPIPRSMFLNVRDQDDVFFWCPRTFLHSNLVTAWWSSHFLSFFLVEWSQIFSSSSSSWVYLSRARTTTLYCSKRKLCRERQASKLRVALCLLSHIYIMDRERRQEKNKSETLTHKEVKKANTHITLRRSHITLRRSQNGQQ